jgi:hypothetical protein
MLLSNHDKYKPTAKIQRKTAFKLEFRDADVKLDLEQVKPDLAELNK